MAIQYPDFKPPAPANIEVPPWIPPPATKERHNFAELTSIDLSKMATGDPKDQAQLVKDVKRAIREDGFLFIENYGVSFEQVGQISAATEVVLTILASPSIRPRSVPP
jgi:hypothetical protein